MEKYDALNRIDGHGTTSSANDVTLTNGCCGPTAYTDSLGTATIAYDDLSRITSYEDTQGSTVAYESDEMGRTEKITPEQGTNYRIQYTFNAMPAAGSTLKC